MTPDDIEHLLRGEDLRPSSGFLDSVMDAVRQDALAPPPLSFPWRRAAPGALALLVACGVAIWTSVGALSDPASTAAVDQWLRDLAALGMRPETQGILIAAVAATLSVAFSLRLMRRHV